MQSPPVINPPVPFVGPVPGGVRDGKTITISGHISANATWFCINLRTSTSSDILFHASFRFDESCVVRNSMFNNSWGTEERQPPYMPLQRGHSFEIMILVERSCYKMAINGRHFIEFAHREPYSKVTTLEIDGNLHVKRIEYRDSVKFPVKPSGYHPNIAICPPGPVHPIPVGGHKYQPVYNPALPFIYSIPGGLQTGTNIYISGRPSLRPRKFEINLQCGTMDESDIAFHFNPRFDAQTVIRNTRINNQWGSEERHGQFSFKNGITFDMLIQVQQNSFSVFLNGLPFISYNHRVLPLSRVNALSIAGDAHISSIQFK